MDWNSITPTGFDWSGEDFDVAALYNGFESGSSPVGNKIDEGIIEMEKINASISNSRASMSSGGESLISLELGKQKVNGSTSSSSSIPASCTATKRSRSTYQKIQNPCCQVEGCNLNLTLAKDYHRRHRICESHSKSPKVVVAGVERRFCQQCSRFHGLSEFDDNKRSCRRRLSDHNARRRRLQPDQSIHFGSVRASSSSSLYDRRSQDLRFNVLPNSVSNRTVDNISSNSTMTQAGDSLARPSKTDQIPCSIYDLHVGSERLLSLQSTINNPEALDRCMSSSLSSYFVVPSSKTFSHPRLPNYKSIKIQCFNQSRSSLKQDLPSAPSLLSTDMQWSLNLDESTSMEELMHGNASVDNPIKLPNCPFFEQPNQDEGPSVSTNLHGSSSSLLQEFDLFKTTYDSV